jgi:histidinol dehydrogenase
VELSLARLDLRAAGVDAPRDPALAALARRGAVPDPAIRAAAREILATIQRGGSAAVTEAGRRYGGGLPDGRLVLRRDELTAAANALDEPTRTALTAAIEHIRRFAERQRPASTVTRIIPGVEIQRRWVPVDRVGAYVPGGAAAYPSSLLMTVVPARVAGAGTVVVASPAGPGGTVNAVLLGAAGLLGVDALVVAGGAQAIGALAYGLPELDIEPADLVVGPGNAWVTAAKLELAGVTAIDLPAGPSEGMVIAEPPADPLRVAADLITQAEHGPDSPALLVTTSPAFADAVESRVAELLAAAPRSSILARSLGVHGRIIVVADLAAAVAVVNAYAPEHLSIDVEDPEPVVAAIRNAGSVFVGPWAPESAGDYATGANHVLPTGGLARGCGALAVETFGKFIQVQRITKEGLRALRPTIRTLAEAEGLPAHAQAVEVRFGDDPPPPDAR